MPILRLLLGVLGFCFVAGAVLAARVGVPVPGVLAPAGIGVVLVVVALFERVHYKAIAPNPPGPGWVATPERFVDPASGRLVEVHVKPATGERLYVDAGPAPPP